MGVQRRQNEMARFRGGERDFHGFPVAYLADENHLRSLTQRGAEASGEIRKILAEFALAEGTADVVVKILRSGPRE